MIASKEKPAPAATGAGLDHSNRETEFVSRSHNITADDIAHGLDAYPKAVGTWHACCPVSTHDDRAHSLRIGVGVKGPLVYCVEGCTQRQVIIALRSLGLWGKAPQDVLIARRQRADLATGWLRKIRSDLARRR